MPNSSIFHKKYPLLVAFLVSVGWNFSSNSASRNRCGIGWITLCVNSLVLVENDTCCFVFGLKCCVSFRNRETQKRTKQNALIHTQKHMRTHMHAHSRAYAITRNQCECECVRGVYVEQHQSYGFGIQYHVSVWESHSTTHKLRACREKKAREFLWVCVLLFAHNK